MDVIKAIGDSIHESIKLECDVPSNYEDGKVPILDLKVWIAEVETEGGIKRKIMHEFYIKNVSSKLVVHKESALSMGTKRTILTQQCLRVLLNCSPDLDKNVAEKHLSYFMLRMQCSGYDTNLRYEILKSAFNAYDKIKCKEEREGVPMYRKKSYKRGERRKEKERKLKGWYGKEKYDTAMFITATPDSRMKKEMQNYVNDNGARIKVVEKSGVRLIKMMQRNDPFKEKECNGENCFICASSKKGGCRGSGITYKIECEEGCNFVYHGQTSANAYTRGLKHMEDYDRKRDKVMWKHCLANHNGERQNFTMQVVDQCRNDPTKRQILEGIRIQKTDISVSMNERAEWNGVAIPRIAITN